MKAHVNYKRLRPIAAGVTVAIGTMTFQPAVAQTTGQPTLPGEPCQTAPLENWTPQEKWVWSKVCVGEIADFNKEEGYGGDLDPNKPKGWPESRVLTPQFLETILLHEPFRSAQTRRGVRIVGAWFKGTIDLRGAQIERELWLDLSRLDSGGSLADARTGLLSLSGSVVGGPLSMQRAEIGNLFMNEGAKFKDVNLLAAKIRDELSMTGSTFTGKLNMAQATVGGSLYMRGGAKFQEVDLHGAEIEGQINMIGSTFAGTLEMNSATVEGYLSMGRAEFHAVNLIAAKIGKVIDMRGSTFDGTLNMNSATVGEDLFMGEGAKFQEVDLIGAKIGDQLDMSGSTFVGTIDLCGATVEGSLDMTGSTFATTLDMNSATLEGDLFMVEAEFQEVTLIAANIGDRLGMTGSTFAGKLNMDGVRVEGHLFMREGAKFQEVTLIGAKIGDQLDMTGSMFGTKLDMNGATLEGGLFMVEAEFQDVILIGAKIGRQLAMIGSTFAGKLNMDGVTVEGHLFMREGAKFQEVTLIGAKIGDQLDMTGSTFAGPLSMASATVEGHLNMIGSSFAGTLDMNGATVEGTLHMVEAEFQDVILIGAKIGRQLAMIGSTFAGTLNMGGFTVAGSLLMREGAKFQEVDLHRANIADQLDMYGSTFAGTIDLRGATVMGELQLSRADDESVWETGSILDLRYAKVGRLAARVGKSSPGSTRLAGFIYDALGTTASQTDERGSAEDAADFVEWWLRKEEVHSPQAHEQFALVLRQMGFPDRARRTLYEGKSHERSEELRRGNLLQAGWLFVLWAMIGYGYRVWHALVWIAALVALGWLIARKSGRKVEDNGEPLGFWYSVDRLLPIVELRKRHYEVDLPRRSRRYFYVHTVMGYVLATFLLAGLSGLVG